MHEFVIINCQNHNCGNCKFNNKGYNEELCVICVANLGGDNCYWESKEVKNNEFIFHERTNECKDHNCKDCKYDLNGLKEEPCINYNTEDCYYEPEIDILNKQIFKIVNEPEYSLQQLKRADLDDK